MNKTFAGFVKGVALGNNRAARNVARYIVKRDEKKSDIRDRMNAALKKGKIDAVYHQTLLAELDEMSAAWHASGRLTDDRDGRDWNDLGNGGRMRKVHLGNV